VTYIFHLIDFG